jgi:hypothetical protein
MSSRSSKLVQQAALDDEGERAPKSLEPLSGSGWCRDSSALDDAWELAI